MKMFNYALSGISWIIDLGGTAGFNLVSWAEMVLENEMAAYVGEYLKGIEVDEERLAVDTILKVGPLPGSYMKEKHTREWYRKEFFLPQLSNKEFFESWERGHVDLQEKAKQQALEILANHQSPVAPEIQQELDSYLGFCMKRDLG
jgi:trimethylamine--corrinoid protein Co-methyltransferase